MEIQLQELIETIKSEGFKTAQASADEIIQKAKDEAASIVAQANSQASSIVSEAKAQAEKEKASANAAIVQSSRDLILNLKKEIEALFSKVIANQVTSSLSGDLLKEAILSVVKGLSTDCSDLSLLVDSKKLSEIEAALKSSLASEVQKGLEIKPFDDIAAGFRVAYKDGSAFYDFSDKEVASVLSGFLNKKLADLLTTAV